MYRPGGFAVLVKRVAKYEVPGPTGNTVLGVEMPKTLFPRGILHSSVIAHIITQKFALGVPHHRFEQYLESQLCQIDRSTMCRYVEEAGGTLGATLVNAMWRDALDNACIISTDATSAMIQPPKDGGSLRQSCKKGHFFTAVVDCQYVLFAYAEKHNQDFVKKLFAGFSGYLQGDASSVYDILGRGPPCNTDEGVILVGCWAHCRRYFFEAALCRYPVGVQGLMRIWNGPEKVDGV
jgi:transposase